MRIITENLKPIQKIWNQIRVRGNSYFDHVMLDFDSKQILFKNGQACVKASLSLEDNDGRGLSHRKMFIDGSKFFSLVQFYDYVDLDENDVFYSSQGDKFIVPELNEEIPFPEAEEGGECKLLTVSFTPELNKKLSIASTYVDPDSESDYYALFVHNESLIACNRTKMLFAQTDNGLKGSFAIPYPLLRLIITMDIQGDVDLRIINDADGYTYIEFSYGDMWIKYGNSEGYVLPFDPDSEDFLSTYDHSTYFCVNLSQIDEAVKFLSSYYNDTVDAICKCVFDTSDPDNMIMTINLSYEQAGASQYRVAMTGCSDPEYFDGKTAFIYLKFIKSAIGILSQFGIESMRVTFDEDAPAMAFMDATEEESTFVVHTVAQEV